MHAWPLISYYRVPTASGVIISCSRESGSLVVDGRGRGYVTGSAGNLIRVFSDLTDRRGRQWHVVGWEKLSLEKEYAHV